MPGKRLALAVAITFALVGLSSTPSRAAVGASGVTPVPCPSQEWQYNDPTFQALPGARALFGRYDGGLYRIEIPATWNGELVLWAHGFINNRGTQGSQLRVGFPGSGQGGPLRQHLIDNGCAWAASSYRCNGFVPGIGLLDTMGLTDVFEKSNGGVAPRRVYLSGSSLGGFVTILGLQEFPTTFAGGLAMCPAGPGALDFLTAVGAASSVIGGVSVSDATADQDLAKLTDVLGSPPTYTEKGRQLASVQIEISGGPRPFALEGLATRFTENVRDAARIATIAEWNRVTTNADVRYTIGANLGLSADVINARVVRKAADSEARSLRGPFDETIPFDGRIERPLMTLHGTGDLYVPISLEQLLKQTVDAAGRQDFLVQRIMRIAGHCGFSASEQMRAFDDLTKWVHKNERPEGDTVFGDLRNAGLRFTDPLRPGDPGTDKP